MHENGTIWEKRLTCLNSVPPASGPVVYWMQRSQRSRSNLALNLAIERGNLQNQPVICYVAVDDSYPLATARTYHFMLEGLRDITAGLIKRGVGCVVRCERGDQGIVRLARELRASLVVTDESHLHFGRRRRNQAAMSLALVRIPLWQVDNDLVVPVRIPGREHYAARTIRGLILRHRDQFLQPIPDPAAQVVPPELHSDVDTTDVDGTLARLNISPTVPPSTTIRGGERTALQRLQTFVETSLTRYHQDRNDASQLASSRLSPYLHFGQIDPWTVSLAVENADAPGDARESFLEELLVRRELAANYTYYNPSYDSLEGLPAWAKRTLEAHTSDTRSHCYSLQRLTEATTDDPLWNAAQRELLITGSMHNWVRMYWGKRVMEWTSTPAEAFAHTLHLNNLYALDGRDPVSFANIAWCYGKHDRPWPQRPIFGTVRSMTLAGARRKFDVDGYILRIDGLTSGQVDCAR